MITENVRKVIAYQLNYIHVSGKISAMTKFLSQLITAADFEPVLIGGTDTHTDFAGIPVTDITFDSRNVTENSLFFALPGIHADGNDFIPAAVERGASAVIFQGELSPETAEKTAEAVRARKTGSAAGPVFLRTKDSRRTMAPVSCSFYGNPSEKMVVIGVTGTEGKSSTVSFIWQLLRACGKKAGFISTVEYSLGDEAVPNPQHQTTPEAPLIQKNLAAMLANGCEYAVVETSSHGLSEKLNRCGGILFDCAVFMNVTLEHLEFHKTFEQYRDDKANLFRALDRHDHEKFISGQKRRINSIGIVNLEDSSAQYFIGATKHHVYGFTTEGKAGKAAAENGADAVALAPVPDNMRFMSAHNIAAAKFGISFSADADGTDAVYPPDYDPVIPRAHTHLKIKAPVSGAFNAYNIMAAVIAVSSVTELSFSVIAEKTPELVPIKGRMTVVDDGQPFEVIVDYAHTPSSFETIFPPLRKRCTGRMIALFGSGGERDLTKRPLQGQIAAKFCDEIYLTDEDPRGEDSVTLLKMIAEGAEKEGMKEDENLFIIPDRPAAIRKAFASARKGDIVLLLGKSHENSIIYKNFVMPYDEIAEAHKALKEL